MAGYECWRDSHPVSWAALPSPGPGTAWGQLAAHVPVWFSADLGLVLADSSLLSSLSKGGRLTWKSRSPQHSGKGPYIGILWTPVQISALPLTSCVARKVASTHPRFPPLTQDC